MAVKIVVVGSINGALKSFFTKLAKLQAKNSFSIAIVVGDLFGEETTDESQEELTALLTGVTSVPLPTYFTLGESILPPRIIQKLETDDEVCPNLFFLGRRGTIKTSEGLRIVTLGGQLDVKPFENAEDAKYVPIYTETDARSLNGAHNADILISNQWPYGVQSGTQVETSSPAPTGVKCVADLCSVLKPRYHFSSSPQLFYERLPFFHRYSEENSLARPITRFISLAAVNNDSKQKWLYAFSLEPGSEPPTTVPPGSTPSPFATVAVKRPAAQQNFSRFSQGDDSHRRGKRQRQAPPTPAECFFCLSNPNTATHLITSIGNDAYLTTAKGPLTTSTTFPSLKIQSHILIIPLNHSPNLASIPDAAVRASTYEEMQKYRASLHSMLQHQSNHNLGSITWEVSRANGIHVHWQFLPVPADLIENGLVEAAFKVQAENDKYPPISQRDIGDGSKERGDYFRFWIRSPSAPSNSTEATGNGDAQPATDKSYILPLSPDFRFDIQFGRRVMAKLLKLDSRMDWRDATQTEGEEEADAQAFKDAFKQFDFSLQE